MQTLTRNLLLIALALFVLAGALFYPWLATPPEAARLLPECDAIIYFGLKPIRAATHLDRNPAKPSPAYQQFIDATGIVAERDLDEAVFALNHMPDPSGVNGPVAYTEVLLGRFDEKRLTTYLSSQSKSEESFEGHTIYLIPSQQGYLDRVTILDSRTVAVSNAPTPEQLHAVIEHSGRLFAGSGPLLLSGLYGEVPHFAPVWAIGQLGLPFSEDGKVSLAGLQLPTLADTPFIASLRFTGAVELEVQELAGSDAAAQRAAQSLNGLLGVLRNLQQAQQPAPAVSQVLNSVTIVAEKDRATMRATIPLDLLKKVIQPTQ